jgi:triosephosphate isomerase (TIM)
MKIPRPVIAGNWKMYHTPSETRAYFREFLPLLPADLEATVAFFPPALSFAAAVAGIKSGPDILLGVQNVYWEENGAFTGENSVAMAADAGARLVLVGHSERRHVFGETGEESSRKVLAALAAGLTPVLCVGEKLGEREAGQAREVVERQLAEGYTSLEPEQADRMMIAYEPVWAIGTGKTASPADAEEMHGAIRRWLSERVSPAIAARTPILYGGSVKPENAGDLLRTADVDGVLVGGASLNPADFARICTALA